jgi:hypothetical protein
LKHLRSRFLVPHLLASSLAGALCLFGCGPAPASADADAGTFIAVTGDFAGFQSWPSFDGGSQPGDSFNVTAQRTLYINHLPPAGAAAFPVGTIIVKTTEGYQTFAMVKRGDGFNASGANDWEWFEISSVGGGNPIVVWRGISPPATETYAGMTSESCNACHVTFAGNDYVGGNALHLAR